MDLVAIETPAARMAFSGETLKFGDTVIGIVAARKLLQVVAHHLIKALAQCVSPLARSLDQLLIHRKRKIHEHIVRAHVLRVNRPRETGLSPRTQERQTGVGSRKPGAGSRLSPPVTFITISRDIRHGLKFMSLLTFHAG